MGGASLHTDALRGLSRRQPHLRELQGGLPQTEQAQGNSQSPGEGQVVQPAKRQT